MHLMLAALVTLAVALQPAVALGADLSGVWVVDQVAWRQQLDGNRRLAATGLWG